MDPWGRLSPGSLAPADFSSPPGAKESLIKRHESPGPFWVGVSVPRSFVKSLGARACPPAGSAAAGYRLSVEHLLHQEAPVSKARPLPQLRSPRCGLTGDIFMRELWLKEPQALGFLLPWSCRVNSTAGLLRACGGPVIGSPTPVLRVALPGVQGGGPAGEWVAQLGDGAGARPIPGGSGGPSV